MIPWLRKSNRYKYLLGGLIVGLGANSWYCAVYTGTGVAGALEFKDGRWDWIDFICTLVGVLFGYLFRYLTERLIYEII